MFNLAKHDGKIRELPYFPTVKEAAPRQGFLEREQYDTLARALPDYLRLPLALGYYTGMREGEVLGLKWSDVDFLVNVIRLSAGTTKNDEGREIPIVPQLRVLIDQQRRKLQPGCEHVCFRVNRLGHSGKIRGFRKAWYSACCRCGLGRMEPKLDPVTGEIVFAKARPDRRKAKPKIKMIYRGMIFHDLRRTGVRNLVRAGVPERVAMQVTGHKTRSVFERYNTVSPTDINQAREKLANFHAQEVRDSPGTDCTTVQQDNLRNN